MFRVQYQWGWKKIAYLKQVCKWLNVFLFFQIKFLAWNVYFIMHSFAWKLHSDDSNNGGSSMDFTNRDFRTNI